MPEEIKAFEAEVSEFGDPMSMMEDPAERNICDSCA